MAFTGETIFGGERDWKLEQEQELDEKTGLQA
jgi:hypothetical protein